MNEYYDEIVLTMTEVRAWRKELKKVREEREILDNRCQWLLERLNPAELLVSLKDGKKNETDTPI